MRVVLTCDWFLKYASAQGAALARAGVDVLLLCRAHAHEFGEDTAEREVALERARRAGVEVVEIPRRLSDARALPDLLKIRRKLRRFAPDLAHAHDGADPRALLLLRHLPTVLTLHDPVPHPGQPVPAARKRWFLHGSRDAWRSRADVLVVHSERLRSEVRLDSGQRCVVLPPGLDVLPGAVPSPP